MVKFSSEKESLTLLKQRETFEELVIERIDEIQNLSKLIDFNNLVYYFKGECGTKNFIDFKGPLDFYENIKDGYTILEKPEQNRKNLNHINEIAKGRNKPEEQKTAIKNIKILNKSQEKVIKLFNDYSKIV